MILFSDRGRTLKGNLHTHSTISDGRLPAEEVIRIYREAGYDFLALTDHRRRYGGGIVRKDGTAVFAGTGETDVRGGDCVEESLYGTEDYAFLVIPSTEFDRNFTKEAPEFAYHITGIGLREYVPQTNETTPQEIVDSIHGAGGYAVLAHPAWSIMTSEQCLSLERYDALEVYNTISDVNHGRGYSEIYADILASRSRSAGLIAADDAHGYERDHKKGFIIVEAESNNWPSIHRSLLGGRFYASTGPSIHELSREEDRVRVVTSEVACIRFISNQLGAPGRAQFPAAGETFLTGGEYTFHEKDRFVRVEAEDRNGRKCWSNIIMR